MEGRSRNALPHKGKALLVVHHNRFYIRRQLRQSCCALRCTSTIKRLKDLNCCLSFQAGVFTSVKHLPKSWIILAAWAGFRFSFKNKVFCGAVGSKLESRVAYVWRETPVRLFWQINKGLQYRGFSLPLFLVCFLYYYFFLTLSFKNSNYHAAFLSQCAEEQTCPIPKFNKTGKFSMLILPMQSMSFKTVSPCTLRTKGMFLQKHVWLLKQQVEIPWWGKGQCFHKSVRCCPAPPLTGKVGENFPSFPIKIALWKSFRSPGWEHDC